MKRVVVDRGPDVQLLGGEVAAIQGAAALDAYRLMVEGIGVVRRRDGIEPPPRLMQTVAVLKAAAMAASNTANSSDVRSDPDSAKSVLTGEVIGIEEAARMYGCEIWQARRLAASWGGRRGHSRGRPWQFDPGLVQAYIDAEGRR